MNNLFTPYALGPYQLRNRVLMAPMTRSRADAQGVPSEIMLTYYAQRASAGLIVSEGIQPSANGKGYARTPGLHTPAQIKAWKKIVDEVHRQGGLIFAQLMHVGRIAHPLNKALNAQTVAPSAIKATGMIYTDQAGLQEFVMPKALDIQEILDVIQEYKLATINAFEAGFDGVELHAASGYLPMQFMSSNTNLRKDSYGGTIENRLRFPLQVLDVMSEVAGSNRVGVRIWPGSTFNDIEDSDPISTYTQFLTALNTKQLAYVHVIRSPNPDIDSFKLVREHYQGSCMINGGLTLIAAQEAIRSKAADVVSFGTSFLANPDLVKRFQQNALLNAPNPNTFYTSGSEGYIDYPFF
jgi:N-ethylmaleimide reductase